MTNKQSEPIFQFTPEMMEMMQMMARQMAHEMMSQQQEVKPTQEKKDKSVVKLSKKYLREKYKNETITLVNVTSGSVTYKSPKGGYPYVWAGYGDTDEISIDDLLVMPTKYLTSPWLMIIDQEGDIVETLGLGKYYKFMNLLEEIEDIENVDFDALEEAVKTFSHSREFVNKVSTRVQEKIDNGELKDIYKMMKLEKILGKDLLKPTKI